MAASFVEDVASVAAVAVVDSTVESSVADKPAQAGAVDLLRLVVV